MSKPQHGFATAFICGALAAASSTHAVIILQSEQRNTAAPPASLQPVWNLQGRLGNFNATPIGPGHFIAAKHIGGAVGQSFAYGTQLYTLTAATDLPGTDLRVWSIDTLNGTHTLPTYAALWNPATDGSEVGKPLFVNGRGTQRGEAVYAPVNPGTPVGSRNRSLSLLSGGGEGNGDALLPSALLGPSPNGQGDLRGWKWGPSDYVSSWGQNIVDYAYTDPTYGDLIAFNFDQGSLAVPNEAMLSSGDSSGGVFAQAPNGQWKLIGVNLGVDGSWSTTAAGPYFGGAIFDARGLYVGTTANHQLLGYSEAALPASSYSTRVSSYYGQLSAITGLSASDPNSGGIYVPEPTSLSMLLPFALLRRRRG